MKSRLIVGALAAGVVGVGAALWTMREPLRVVADIARVSRSAPALLSVRQQQRVAALIAFARARSPYYRDLYKHLPASVDDLRALPVVTKPDLMAHFDDCVTDPSVTRAGVDAYVADSSLIGKDYLGHYAVWTTSGTTGKPGVFLHDQRAMLVYTAIVALRSYRWVTPALLWYLWWHGRIAVLVATGGHYAIADWFERARRSRMLRGHIRICSVLTPLGELVGELNDFRPTLLLGYPSVIRLLAEEQRMGRLRLKPAFIGTGGESLESAVRAQIVEAFGCVVRDNYGASEFPYVAAECAHDWLHVNADWTLIEPVDAAYRPVPPGQPSYTTLLTNLANRIQPLIRYDLGDSITVKPDPCLCGLTLPAIRVEGRKGDALRLATVAGGSVAVLPLAVAAVVEETPGVRRAQIIQTGHSELTLRLEAGEGATAAESARVWEQVERRLRDYLAAQGLPSVSIVRAPEPPHPDAVSGKYREVWSALSQSDSSSRL
ncbi:MAG TPA: phenylacetate--CoA ligase family protein [Ktedonobacterales bacterium]|nr:phenylacetate--CoA ligase family protein [Ktedonobacterales bacterium]